MSSKRKTTKPMRVAETSNQVDYKHLLVPVCAPQQQATLSHASHPNYKNEFNGTSPASTNNHNVPNICISEINPDFEQDQKYSLPLSGSATESENKEQSTSWQHSSIRANNIQSLPTMVSPQSVNIKWSANCIYDSQGNEIVNQLHNVLTNGKRVDPVISNSSDSCPPLKRGRKIRYKYQPNSEVEVKFKCEICQYCTNRSDHYKRHLITHSAVKPLKCSICGYGTGRSDHFRRHLSRHGLSKDEIEKQCEKNGIRSQQSRSNQRNLNGVLSENVSSVPLLPTPAAEAGGESSLPAAKRYNCTLCGYSTDRTSRYSRHVQIHSNDRPHQCETCGKGFKLDLYLRKHRCALKSKPAETAAEKSDAGSSPLNLDSLFDPDSFLAATTHQCLACGVAFVNLNDMASHLCSNMLENS